MLKRHPNSLVNKFNRTSFFSEESSWILFKGHDKGNICVFKHTKGNAVLTKCEPYVNRNQIWDRRFSAFCPAFIQGQALYGRSWIMELVVLFKLLSLLSSPLRSSSLLFLPSPLSHKHM